MYMVIHCMHSVHVYLYIYNLCIFGPILFLALTLEELLMLHVRAVHVSQQMITGSLVIVLLPMHLYQYYVLTK